MNTAKFNIGDRVRKVKGSQWKGVVVGTYSTELTQEGYAVESDTERGSVQIYPAAALELCEASTQQASVEPVGHVTSWRDVDGDWHASAVYYGEPPETMTKLYTAPPDAEALRKRISNVLRKYNYPETLDVPDLLDIVLAGIKQEIETKEVFKSEMLRLETERDEARAEVERMRKNVEEAITEIRELMQERCALRDALEAIIADETPYGNLASSMAATARAALAARKEG